MSSIRELQRLQEMDTELSSRRQMLDEIQSQLDDTAAVQELRERDAEERRKLSELEPRQRSLEWDVEAIREHLKGVERKLYSGEIKNPKELMGFHEEAALLKTRQQQQEDGVLAIMTQVEEQQNRCADLARDLAQAESERKALEEHLTGRQQHLDAEVRQLTSLHGQVAAMVSQQDLGLYNALLSTKQGRAVARVERSMCQGCRINLPMNIQQRVRTDQGLVQCPSCGRVLFMV